MVISRHHNLPLDFTNLMIMTARVHVPCAVALYFLVICQIIASSADLAGGDPFPAPRRSFVLIFSPAPPSDAPSRLPIHAIVSLLSTLMAIYSIAVDLITLER